MPTASFDAKYFDETEFFAADFTALLTTGETISSSSCVCHLADDETLTDIPAMKVGSSSISGAKIVQKVTGGTDGVLYKLRFTAVTSFGQTLVLSVFLPVSEDQ